MTLKTLPGDPPLDITLRRSARARRFSLRVSQLDGRVTLSMPLRAPESEALDFARDKAAWIRRKLAESPRRQAVAPGGQVPFEGRRLTVLAAAIPAVSVDGDRLLVPRGGALSLLLACVTGEPSTTAGAVDPASSARTVDATPAEGRAQAVVDDAAVDRGGHRRIEGPHGQAGRRHQLAPNFSSLIASKSVTSPPTRFVV